MSSILSICKQERGPTSDIDEIITDNLQRRLLRVRHLSHPLTILSRPPPRSPIIVPLTSCLDYSLSPCSPWFIYFTKVNETHIFTGVSRQDGFTEILKCPVSRICLRIFKCNYLSVITFFEISKCTIYTFSLWEISLLWSFFQIAKIASSLKRVTSCR